MKPTFEKSSLIFAIWLIFTLACNAFSQIPNIDVLERNLVRAVYFRPSFPSTSALGSGGTFLAQESDVAAGETNPAALFGLAHRELYVQLRNGIYVNHEIGFPGEHRNSATNLSNICFSVPPQRIKPLGRNIAFSLYKFEGVNFENAFYFEKDVENSRNGLITDYKVVLNTWGLSMATRLSGSDSFPYLDFGLSLKLLTLEYNLEQEIFEGARPEDGNVPEELAFITVANSEDRRPTIQLGLLYRGRGFRIGLSGALGRTFSVGTFVFTPARFSGDQGRAGAIIFPRELKLSPPSWLGLGVAAALGESWEIEADLLRFWHSNQAEELQKSSLMIDQLDQDNKWSPRIGFTKTFRDSTARDKARFRFGYYYENDAQLTSNSADLRLQRILKPATDMHHITAGIELGLVPEITPRIYRLWVNVAVDYSPNNASFGTVRGTNVLELLLSLKLKFL